MRTIFPALVAACAMQAAAPAAAAAEDTSELESLLLAPVYAASKYQQSVADAPAAVSIITQGEIRAFGWRTLAEALNAVRGVYTRKDSGYSYVGVRGLGRPGDYSSRLLLLVDGVRINDNLYDSVMTGRESPLDIEMIERIEFIPGPASALYGSNAVLGTINLVTRSAASLRGTQAEAAIDTQGGWKLGGSTTAEYPAGSLLVAAHVELRPGQTLAFPEFASPDNPGGVVHGQDGEDATRVFTRFETGNWSAELMAGRRSREIPDAPFGLVFGDPAAEWTDSLGVVGLSWHPQKVDGEGWEAQVGLGRYHYGDYGRYEPDRELLRYSEVGVWAQGEVNRTLHRGRHLLLLGADLQRDIQQDFRQRQLEPARQPMETVFAADGTRLGFHVSDDITLGKAWRLGLGARLDHTSYTDWTVTPRVSLQWRPVETLSLKALAGAAYRNPNVYERVSVAPAAPGEDAGLHRERTSTSELAADWQPLAALRVSASAYRYDVSKMIEQVVDEDTGEVGFRNTRNSHVHGLELEGEYLASGGVRLRSSVSHEAARTSGGDRLTNSPEWLAKLHATGPVPATSLRAALELQAMGPRMTEAGATLHSQLLTNVSLGWNSPGRRWSASITVTNLFDRRLFDPNGTEYVSDRSLQDGREATLRFYVSF